MKKLRTAIITLIAIGSLTTIAAPAYAADEAPPTVWQQWIMPAGTDWPQQVATPENLAALPCNTTWRIQNDEYLPTERDSFVADGVLYQGEDYQNDTQRGAISWYFTEHVTPACEEEVPPVFVTPTTPETFTRECYAAGEKPQVIPAQDGHFTYVVTEDPLNVFTVVATPIIEGEFTDVPAAIAAGWTHTESQTVVRTYDLSYAPTCIAEEEPAATVPAPEETAPAEEAPAPEAAVRPALAATGIEDGWPVTLAIAGALLAFGAVLRFRRTPNLENRSQS